MPDAFAMTPYTDPDLSAWFYRGWPPLVRVAIVGLLAYVGLVVLLRVTGKRTLSKMNAFDLVVTVALGSTLASTLLSKDVALLEGLTAFALLILIQLAVAWTCARSPAADNIVKSTPTIILWRGELLKDVIRRERLSEGEVMSTLRAAGHGNYADVAAVVLETTGDLSVITGGVAMQDLHADDSGPKSTLQGVDRQAGG